jgi:hypothetical protein
MAEAGKDALRVGFDRTIKLTVHESVPKLACSLTSISTMGRH